MGLWGEAVEGARLQGVGSSELVKGSCVLGEQDLGAQVLKGLFLKRWVHLHDAARDVLARVMARWPGIYSLVALHATPLGHSVAGVVVGVVRATGDARKRRAPAGGVWVAVAPHLLLSRLLLCVFARAPSAGGGEVAYPPHHFVSPVLVCGFGAQSVCPPVSVWGSGGARGVYVRRLGSRRRKSTRSP